MTPIERACRALCDLEGHPPGATMEGKPLWHSYIPEVLAVIAAIREPSEDMVEAAYRREGVGPDAVDVPFSLPPDDVWPAMIDALLEEGK